MKPINFKESNRNQKEFKKTSFNYSKITDHTLEKANYYALIQGGIGAMCFKLSLKERIQILLFGKLCNKLSRTYP